MAIQGALLQHQHACGRLDLVARVFELKRKALMDEITNKNVFGKVVAHVHTIEFQKRGLLHIHLLIFLEKSEKIRTVEQVDKYVSAEFPDENEDLILFDTVTKCMVHVPCGVRAVKYINKYIYKGYDKTTVAVGAKDEVQMYIHARYIGPPEAAWHLFGYSMHREEPNVVRLAIHFPGKQRIIYESEGSIEGFTDKAENYKSTLMSYFEFYAENPTAPAYTYQEFRSTLSGVIKSGKSYNGVLQLLECTFVSPNAEELLRTVNGELCHTFKKACIALGLLKHDGEWIALLEEAVDIQTGSQLRKLFKIVLSDCNLTEPELLWAKFGLKMCDDLPHRLRTMFGIQNPRDERVLDYGLYCSLLLVGGRTAHSTFRIPIEINERSHIFCVESVNKLLKDICENDLQFGGVTVVMGGDFRQTFPVIPNGGRADVVGACIRSSVIWKNIKVLTLTKNMRLDQCDQENTDFADFLLEVGSKPEEKIGLPSSVNRCKDMKELISKLYPSLGTCNQVSPEELTERIILSARNDDVNDINMEVLNILDGDTYTYLDADRLNPDESGKIPHYSSEFLQNLNPPGMPLFKLTLKIGCPVILMRNLSSSEGLCNGTRLLVTKCGRHVIQAKIITGHKAGDTVLLPRISFQPSVSKLNVNMSRRQFPVRVAYTMAINKSQGLSVKYVGIDLKTPVFSHGQLYVALSRCTAAKRITVLLEEDTEKLETTNIDKPQTSSGINRIISAKIPEKKEDPDGHKGVVQFMLHGPCVINKLDQKYMRDNKCSKHYPKAFNIQTTSYVNGNNNRSSIDKPQTSSGINHIISAKIPDKEEDPDGHKGVVQFMLHGPCVINKLDQKYMRDNKCSKHYPKAFNIQTTSNVNGNNNRSSIVIFRYII
ncbi:uncharacterized protein LOC113279570 [Papaver somniferum]|uniref:uncharacterized protein LOC113279570 n=1 Tax=Papaver somniferum TaxID=3469 RepID=UPI000E704D2C|nr:uncharacterized protein LOC113279570 [Papaver somniferum]